MSSRLRKGFYGCLIIGLLLSATLVIGVARSRPVQIAWHRWRMDAARLAHYSQPGENIGNIRALEVGRDWSNYEKHRTSLVRLGAVAERHFMFRHIISPTDESKHLVSALFDNAPPSIDWSAPHPEPPARQTIAVWCWAEHACAWDEWVEARNVPDYRQRFMQEPD